MAASLLNDNQRRHLATAFHLLAEDLERLQVLAGVPTDIHDRVDAVLHSVRQVVHDLKLPPPRHRDALHSVSVVAGTWAMRAHELRASRLRGYGPVHPALGDRLDPLIDQLQAALYALADASGTRSAGTEDESAPTRHDGS